jgi:hypothetical protein
MIFKILVMATSFLSFPFPKDSDSTSTIVQSCSRYDSKNPAKRNLPKTQAPVSGVFSGDVSQTRFLSFKSILHSTLTVYKELPLAWPISYWRLLLAFNTELYNRCYNFSYLPNKC